MKKRSLKQSKVANSIKNGMIEAGLNPKKEIATIVLLDVAIIAFGIYLYMLQRSIYPLFSVFAVLALADYFLINRYVSILRKKKMELEQEFIRLFTYFSIYIKDGIPVYSALSLTNRFASQLMKERINSLLTKIDDDKSIKPYLEFSNDFDSITIREVMISIYRMVEEGGSSTYARQFEYLFEGLAAAKRSEDRERKRKRLSNLTFLPVLASGFTMVVLSYGVVGIIGGMTTNGL